MFAKAIATSSCVVPGLPVTATLAPPACKTRNRPAVFGSTCRHIPIVSPLSGFSRSNSSQSMLRTRRRGKIQSNLRTPCSSISLDTISRFIRISFPLIHELLHKLFHKVIRTSHRKHFTLPRKRIRRNTGSVS